MNEPRFGRSAHERLRASNCDELFQSLKSAPDGAWGAHQISINVRPSKRRKIIMPNGGIKLE
ncbi:protein of unknown function [Methylocella tundrae]|uniref:Uncharacterized protein n=1 Tax=Methylocella tundrae TaxID=227605 RepID=A0A4U8Z2F4_METTU|nr:protein of unknown function [Methylocella tundrae]